jgi:hypothetical protein
MSSNLCNLVTANITKYAKSIYDDMWSIVAEKSDDIDTIESDDEADKEIDNIESDDIGDDFIKFIKNYVSANAKDDRATKKFIKKIRSNKDFIKSYVEIFSNNDPGLEKTELIHDFIHMVYAESKFVGANIGTKYFDKQTLFKYIDALLTDIDDDSELDIMLDPVYKLDDTSVKRWVATSNTKVDISLYFYTYFQFFYIILKF